MSITKSYNKKTNTMYAYETLYVWDEDKQKKVQKRRCIGKIDPATGKIIPNLNRGRPSLNVLTPNSIMSAEQQLQLEKQAQAKQKRKLKRIVGRIDRLNHALLSLQQELTTLKEELQEEIN